MPARVIVALSTTPWLWIVLTVLEGWDRVRRGFAAPSLRPVLVEGPQRGGAAGLSPDRQRRRRAGPGWRSRGCGPRASGGAAGAWRTRPWRGGAPSGWPHARSG